MMKLVLHGTWYSVTEISPSDDLKSVPDDLRYILEQCLVEEASPQTLALYLPEIRERITNLLEGLRTMQNEYRNSASLETAPLP
jgi:hypothetical protein